MDVLIISIEDDVAAVEVGHMGAVESQRFAEQVADLAHMPVRWAVVETIPVSDVGPGDIADSLASPAVDVPTATFETAET